jgi:hypothetical protein
MEGAGLYINGKETEKRLSGLVVKVSRALH